MTFVIITYGYKKDVPIELDPDETVYQLIERFMNTYDMPGNAVNAIIRLNDKTLEHDARCSGIPANANLTYINASATFSKDAQKNLAKHRANSPGTQRIVDADTQQVYDNYPELLVNNTNSVYIRIELNDCEDVAVIDTGAEMSTISLDTAIRCRLEKHIDRRLEGEALGVGSAKIVGKIHLAQLKYGNEYFPVNMTVIDSPVHTLIGMPFLRMYRMVIDLAALQVRIGTTCLPIMSDEDVKKFKEDFMKQLGDGK